MSEWGPTPQRGLDDQSGTNIPSKGAGRDDRLQNHQSFIELPSEHRKPAGWWVGWFRTSKTVSIEGQRRSLTIALRPHPVPNHLTRKTPMPPASRLVGLGPILKLRMLGLEFNDDLSTGYDADSK